MTLPCLERTSCLGRDSKHFDCQKAGQKSIQLLMECLNYLMIRCRGIKTQRSSACQCHYNTADMIREDLRHHIVYLWCTVRRALRLNFPISCTFCLAVNYGIGEDGTRRHLVPISLQLRGGCNEGPGNLHQPAEQNLQVFLTTPREDCI